MAESAKPPSGRTILKAIREELMLNLYPLPFSTLPVTVYHVYLHPRDFEIVEHIVPRIVEQVQQALTEEVLRFNARLARPASRVLTRLLDRDEALSPIEPPSSGWDIHIQADPDGELQPGQLGIVSTLSLAAVAEYGGTPTTRIVKSVVAEGKRTASAAEIHRTEAPSQPSEPGSDTPERARLTYRDDQGAHVFSIRKDAVAVGRGGSAAWVDVQVMTNAKVSREHFRIRRDSQGRFFIQDVSSWGTSVDGTPIAPAVKSAEGVLQPGPEQPLPTHASIGLADALVMQFDAADPR